MKDDDFDLNSEAAELQPTTAQPPTADSAPTDLTGTTIGPYKLMEQIGEGGMGVVYVAEQQHPVKRRVALKIIKPGMDTKEVMARFEAERQALAMMEHPNIAHVLDAGATEAGRPFFVMELVRGIPITQFCDKKRLDAKDRLELFFDVTQAIQHAHQKGIIHRDIKPSNVLVTLHDVKPVVKVIDFGVAKAIHQQLTDRTVYTKFTQMVGTPLYMSPEQAEMSGLDIDTRSDIYSMGVLLYELLAGDTPFDRHRLKGAAHDEVRRIIREEEPHKPSTRISSLGDTAVSVSESRGTDPRKLCHQLRGDLDWIVMKALDKDRTRRYETANGFGMDIRRYLKNELVLASPPSVLYRLRKMIRRNRGLFAAATAISIVLIAGIIGTSIGLITTMRANETIRDQNDKLDGTNRQLSTANRQVQEKNAELAAVNARERAARKRADAVRDYLVSAFRRVDPSQDGRHLRVVEILDRSVVELAEKLSEDPGTHADLLAAIGSSYRGLGMHRKALVVFQREQTLREQLSEPDQRLLLKSRYHVGLCLYDDGKYDDAIKLIEATLGTQRELFGEKNAHTLNSMNALAMAYGAASRQKESLQLYEKVLERRRELHGQDAHETLMASNNLATAYQASGRLQESLKLFQDVLAKRREIQGEDHLMTLLAMDRLGNILKAVGRPKDAVPLYEEALQQRRLKLGDDHPKTLESISGLGFAYRDAGRLDDARRLLDESLQGKRAKFGDDHPTTFAALDSLARIYIELGQFDKALPLVKQGYEKNHAKFGEDHKRTRASMNTLGMTYYKVGQPEEALKVFERLLALYRKDPGDDHPTTNTIANNLAMTYRYVGQYAAAEPILKKTLAWRRKKLGDDHPKTMATLANLAGLYRSLGRYQQAVEMGEQALQLHDKKLTEKHRQTLSTMNVLANIYLAAGKWRKAVSLAEHAADVTASHLGGEHPDVFTAQDTLGMCYLAAGRPREAEGLVEQALQQRRAKLGAKHPATIASIMNQARVCLVLDRSQQALPLAKQAFDFMLAARGRQHPTTMKAMNIQANVLAAAGRAKEAITLFHQGDESQRLLGKVASQRAAALGVSHPHAQDSWLAFAQGRIMKREYELAESELEKLWKAGSEVADSDRLPSQQQRRRRTAQAFVDLYRAWNKPEKLAEWMKLVGDGQKGKRSS